MDEAPDMGAPPGAGQGHVPLELGGAQPPSTADTNAAE